MLVAMKLALVVLLAVVLSTLLSLLASRSRPGAVGLFTMTVGANVEEGQASQSKADFAAKYSIACKEAREAHYWLPLLIATELALPAHCDRTGAGVAIVGYG